MADVAERAGVSRTLVSFIFSGKPGAGEETRHRVLEAAAALDYRPDNAARLLARGRSKTLGVLIDVHQSFQADLVTRIYPAAEAAGYEVLLSASAPGRDEAKAIESLISHRCEGLLLLGPYSDAEYLTSLEERAVVVVVGRSLVDSPVDTVHSADRIGIEQSVDYLVALGHSRIHHVDGGDEPGARERRLAYLDAMAGHGLAHEVKMLPGAHSESAGIAAGRQMLAEGGLPTAVLAGNDRCALGLMDALGRAGVDVPGDVSVVGFDDSETSHLSRIDLTTVRQDVDGLAENAVRVAIARLENDEVEPTEIVLEPKLVVRGSTGEVRSAYRTRVLGASRRVDTVQP